MNIRPESFPASHSLPGPILDQGTDNSCSGHAVAAARNAMLGVMSGTGSTDPRFVWHMARHIATGGDPDGLGADASLIKRAIEQYGFLHIGESSGWPYTPEQLALAATRRCKFVPVPVSSIYLQALAFKRQLCCGRPIIIEFNRAQGFGNGTNGAPWGAHDWPAGGLPESDTHWSAIVGFADSVTRFKVQQSSGTSWGDAGYFGMPYGHVTAYGTIKNAYVLDAIPGHKYSPAPGYVPPIDDTPTDAELLAFGKRRYARVVSQLTQGTTPEAMVEIAKQNDMSTAIVECAFQQERGALRALEQSIPAIAGIEKDV